MPVCGRATSTFLQHLFQIQTVYASCPPSDCLAMAGKTLLNVIPVDLAAGRTTTPRMTHCPLMASLIPGVIAGAFPNVDVSL